jgi:hypothetical protein
MGNAPPDLGQGVDFALAREAKNLGEKIKILSQQLEQRRALGPQDQGALAPLARELDGARRSYGTLLIRLQEASPEYASLIRPSPITLPEVQRLLDGDTTLIEYFVLADDSFAWVIEKDSFHLVHLLLNGEQIARQVQGLRLRIAARKPIAADAFILYTGLFSGLTPHIPSSCRMELCTLFPSQCSRQISGEPISSNTMH